MTAKLALTVPEAAEACSVAERRIREAIHSGDLRAKQPGRHYVIRVCDLEAWLDGMRDA